MTDRPGIPGPDGDNRQEAEEFLRRMVGSLVVAKVRQLRSEGLDDEAIQSAVLAFALDRASGISAFERDRERLISWIERALEDALAEPWPDDFAEPLRRITDRVEGEPILLADGEAWTFPRLDLEKAPRILADGSIDLQYPWIQDPDGIDLLTELIWIDHGISDPSTVLSHLMTAGTLLLRRNYSLTETECRQLMPIDPENPECVGALIARPPEEIRTGLTEGIVTALLTLLAPVIAEIRKDNVEE
ncbi:hypothetical protein SAMN05444166_1072 [Singulisphaera sp. GP187]|uniref:hypothetical protein n=1 Tax=Singulisphaera sp. GP187 TaxID=1882752 RepID=UPI0009269441|nr:hypothetical protein [Singulisphaera sp. GP187]SIN81821.1 hypothetical protein SAMN05444166_1072 [Singulisphaera sp. GP187]